MLRRGLSRIGGAIAVVRRIDSALLWRAVNALLRFRRLLHLHRIEVSRDQRLGVLVRRADDPQHQKKRHHRGHEVSEGDLPRAAVMLVLMRAMPLDNDDFRMRLGHRLRSGLERGQQLGPRAKLGDNLR